MAPAEAGERVYLRIAGAITSAYRPLGERVNLRTAPAAVGGGACLPGTRINLGSVPPEAGERVHLRVTPTAGERVSLRVASAEAGERIYWYLLTHPPTIIRISRFPRKPNYFPRKAPDPNYGGNN